MRYVEEKEQKDSICIVGLGYVGVTLAGAFLAKKQNVVGIEVKKEVRDQLRRGDIHLFEPGIESILKEEINNRLTVQQYIPDNLKSVIICVGTPYSQKDDKPDLSYLKEAIESVKDKMTSDTLIIIRSTLPIGVTREFVLPIIQNKIKNPKVVFAPERTIQGKALEELLNLPQVIGTSNNEHFEQAKRIFEKLGVEVVRVRSFETAEMLKLMCNAHTDILYSFGNEMSNISTKFNIDIHEMIEAANHNYPRPDIATPGYVGGSCLTKDPYHLIYSAKQKGYMPHLVKAARDTNENLLKGIMLQINDILERQELDWSTSKIFVSGLAYKGRPETDDLRGSAIWELLNLLKEKKVKEIMLHDFVIDAQKIEEEFGLKAVTFEAGMKETDIVIILNNHPKYQLYSDNIIDIHKKKQKIIYDVWGIYKEVLKDVTNKKCDYLGVGFNG
ncbi:nucleotide sugar dehydrogenase [Bacillus toyonensis]|nr:nucleotide sugar dehydrogenase [Bacillus toyonensis]